MKINKKGFTLIELLAVIAILAILVVIAVPAVLNLFNSAQENSFITQAQTIYKAAENQYLMNQMSTGASTSFCYDGVSDDAYGELDLKGSKNVTYKVEFNANGQMVYFLVNDGSRSISLTGTVNISDINALEAKDEGSYNTEPDSLTKVECQEPPADEGEGEGGGA